MEVKVNHQDIDRLWKLLQRKHRPGRLDRVRSAHHEVIDTGWATLCDIQDILWETDDRADELSRHQGGLDFLCQASGIRFVTRYRGPFSKTREVYGHTALRAIDAAALIMEIERLGFSVDAQPMVEALRPSLVRCRYLTNSELSVVWYHKQRHKTVAQVLKCNDRVADRVESVITNTGYRVTALIGPDGVAVLRIDAPGAKEPSRLRDYWIKGTLHSLAKNQIK